jgi:hypothetical protein
VSQFISSGDFTPKLCDRTERAALRRQVRRALERSPYINEENMLRPATFTMKSYCDQLADVVGRPVRLMAMDTPMLPSLPFSAIEARDDSYVIYYRADADGFYRDILVFRQIARLLCDLPIPERAFPLDEWTGYDTPDKILVESVATHLAAKTDRMRARPPRDPSARELRAFARELKRINRQSPPHADI